LVIFERGGEDRRNATAIRRFSRSNAAVGAGWLLVFGSSSVACSPKAS
jgi:hypothetical protein